MRRKILVIDDMIQNRLLMRDVLRYYGYEILEAGDGREGIEVAREQKPDLILLDMQMPVMDGFTAAKLLKSDPETNGITIVAVSAFLTENDLQRVLNAGVDHYIGKPVNIRLLHEIIEKFLA